MLNLNTFFAVFKQAQKMLSQLEKDAQLLERGIAKAATVGDTFTLERQMGNLANYFDYEAFARELFMRDYYFDNGHVFRHY